MSYDVLPKKEITKWLQANPSLERPVARYTGITRNTIVWMKEKPDTANISPARQRLLSRVIAMFDNGELVAQKVGTRVELVVPPKPSRPIARYAVEFDPQGPRLRQLDRPKPLRRMPGFRDLLLTKGE